METRKTLCRMCDHGCGMEVEVQNGRPVAIRGWKGHPFSKGWLCVKGLAALDLFHSPMRLEAPLVRREGRLVEATWEEALSLAADRLLSLKRKFGPECLAVYHGEGVGHQEIKAYMKRFANVYGTPNFCGVGSICNASRTLAEALTLGALTKPDVAGTSFLIVWGGNPMVSHEPCIPAEIAGLKRRGGRVVVIDPRRTETAARAHEHLAIRPGTDDVLALNLLHVIFRQGLWDKAFSEKWVAGFEEFCASVSGEEFSPERGAELTGIPGKNVRDLAHAYSANRPACIFTGNGLEHHGHGVDTARLLSILKAVSGNLDAPGGDLFTPRPKLRDISSPLPPPAAPPLGRDRFPLFCRARKEAHALAVNEAVLEERPYPIKGMVIAGGNPSLEWPDSRRTRQALERLEFLLVIDVVRSPDSGYADVVLPACTFLERDEHRVNVYQNLACITLRRRVVEPLHGLPDQMIWVELARRMGMEEYFPWKTCSEGIDEILGDMGITYRDLLAGGGVYEYEDRTYRRYESRGFATPSGKVEIHPEPLIHEGMDPSPIRREAFQSPFRIDEFPLLLTTGGNLLPYTHWQYRYVPRLRRIRPEPEAEIHPETARLYGIAHGALVEVATKTGSIRVKARLTPSVRPDTIHIPQGWEDANVNELTGRDGVDRLSGFPNLKAVPCAVAAQSHSKDQFT